MPVIGFIFAASYLRPFTRSHGASKSALRPTVAARGRGLWQTLERATAEGASRRIARILSSACLGLLGGGIRGLRVLGGGELQRPFALGFGGANLLRVVPGDGTHVAGAHPQHQVIAALIGGDDQI